VQKHRIKTLYCNRRALEKKAGLSLFSREATQLTSISLRNSKDEELKAPKFYIAIGWNIWSDDKLWYFSAFRSAAISTVVIIIIIVTLRHKPSHLLYYTNYLQYRLQSDCKLAAYSRPLLCSCLTLIGQGCRGCVAQANTAEVPPECIMWPISHDCSYMLARY